jgi:hypothetical protein
VNAWQTEPEIEKKGTWLIMRKSFVCSMLSIICVVLLFPAAGRGQNLFEADQDSDTIYEFTTNGVQSTFASLSIPSGLAFDSAGDLFVSSAGDIYEFVNTEGSLNPTPVVFASGLGEPFGLAFYNSNLFVAIGVSSDPLPGQPNDEIVEISPTGTKSTFSTGLMNASGLAIDSTGDLFVLVATNTVRPPTPFRPGALIKITPDGTKSTFANGWTNANVGVAINGSGDILVANAATTGTIVEYAPNGSRIATITGLDEPRFMAFDSFGNLLVGNSGNNTIVKIAPGDSQTTFATGLNFPAGLAVQPPPVLQAINPDIQANVFGFTILGSNSQVVVVESCTNLANPIWAPQATNTLSGESFYYTDPNWMNYPVHYYRVVSP